MTHPLSSDDISNFLPEISNLLAEEIEIWIAF